MSVNDLLHGVIVQSGNDAAIVLAEGIAGTEDAFAEEMNFWAQKLGMTQTNFQNSTGWLNPDLQTSAKDLNILSTEMIKRFPADKYPDLYPIFSKPEFTYNNIKQPNRNPFDLWHGRCRWLENRLYGVNQAMVQWAQPCEMASALLWC